MTMAQSCMPCGSVSVIELCSIKPPEDPPDTLVSPTVVSNTKQKNYEIWSFYQKTCVNINTSSTLAQSTETPTTPTDQPSPTTESYRTSTLFNISSSFPPIGGDQGVSSATANPVLIAVVVSLLVLALCIIIVIVLCVKFKPDLLRKMRLPFQQKRSMPTFSLDIHDRINYINNKAEQGERWKGLEDTETNVEQDADRQLRNNVNIVRPIQVNTEKLDSINQEYAIDNKEKNSEINYNSSANRSPEVKLRHSQPPKETIYANHQFEKVAKRNSGHVNFSYSAGEEYKNKPLPIPAHEPPVDKQTSDMYFIDDSPYDRVDFQGGRASTAKKKPVPTKRKKPPILQMLSKVEGME